MDRLVLLRDEKILTLIPNPAGEIKIPNSGYIIPVMNKLHLIKILKHVL